MSQRPLATAVLPAAVALADPGLHRGYIVGAAIRLLRMKRVDKQRDVLPGGRGNPPIMTHHFFVVYNGPLRQARPRFERQSTHKIFKGHAAAPGRQLPGEGKV